MTLADLEWDFAGDPAGNLEGPRFIHRTYLVRIVNAFLSREAGEGERAPKRAWWRGQAAGRAERSSPYTLSRSDRNFVEEAFPLHPPLPLRGKGKRIRRPVSRVLCRPACAGRGGHSSGPTVTGRFSRPTRVPRSGDAPTRQFPEGPGRRGTPIRSCSWRGLPCGPCHQRPGALLPHPFTLPSVEAEEVCSLWRYPWGHPRWALPTAMSSWSPDFPRAFARDRPAV